MFFRNDGKKTAESNSRNDGKKQQKVALGVTAYQKCFEQPSA